MEALPGERLDLLAAFDGVLFFGIVAESLLSPEPRIVLENLIISLELFCENPISYQAAIITSHFKY
jgi:hypothetical protein